MTARSATVLQVRGLGARAGDTVLLADVDLDLDGGRVLAVLGESGAGKSTLGTALLGESAPGVTLHGSIRIADTELDPAATEPRRRAVRAGRIGLLPQHPGSALDPVRRIDRVLDELARLVTPDRAGRRAAVERALELAGLDERLARRFPHQLSGGQQQRAALASTLVTGPSVLVLDEPTTGLDPGTTAEVVANLAGLARAGTAIVLLTHDLVVARALADDAIVLDRGRVQRRGPAADVLDEPPTPDTGVDTTRADARLVASGMCVRAPDGTVILDDVPLAAPRGCVHAVVGPSGAGKTTLGRCLAGLVTPDAGTVTVSGTALPAALDRRSCEQRRLVQYVHQDARSSFLRRRPVLDQVARPGRLLCGLAPDEARARATALLERLGVDADTAGRRPGGLSGGQLQRAAVARALVADPAVLVCDEVTSALDARHRDELLAVLDTVRGERDTTVVLISHDLPLVTSVADEVTVLDGGRVRDHGPAADVLARMTDALTRH